MTCAQLKDVLSNARPYGKPAGDIAFITTDSRRAAPGCLFVALRGTRADGHEFLDDAYQQGIDWTNVTSSDRVLVRLEVRLLHQRHGH